MNWQEHGIKIVRAGTVVVNPNAKAGPHHHGELETVLYIVRGRARMRWGDRLKFSGEAVVVRSGQDPVAVNLDLETPEPASPSLSDQPFHPSA